MRRVVYLVALGGGRRVWYDSSRAQILSIRPPFDYAFLPRHHETTAICSCFHPAIFTKHLRI